MSREAYHEYFQGYMEVVEQNKKGIERIKRVYVADYYRAEMSNEEWRRSKVLYLVCCLGAVLLFVISAWQNLPCNKTLYAGLTQSLTVLPLLVWSFTIGEYLLSARNLTIGKFQAVHDAMVKRSMAGTVFLGLCIIAVLAGMILQRDTAIWKEMGVIIGYLAGALLCFLTGILEKRRGYIRVENPVEAPEDSIMIR